MVDLKLVKPENLWYIIGLIATDGNLSKDGRHIEITSKNKNHLISVKRALGINIKISKKSRGGSKEKIYPRLQIGDVKFYKFLLDIGLMPRKSLTLGALKINRDYFPDFLRGIIDGDGCISTWIHRTNLNRQWSLRISSAAPLFINWLKKEIEKYFSVKGKLYKYKYKDKKNNIYILKFGKLPAKIILERIYNENAICLSRKNKKCIACLRDENKMINYGNIIGSGAGIGRQPRLKIEWEQSRAGSSPAPSI